MTNYKPTDKNAETMSLACIHGRRLTEVVAPDESQSAWTFQFEGGAYIVVEGLWRIVGRTRVEISRDDHDQRFGLPERVHAGRRALDVIAHTPVVAAKFDAVTGDLRITFGSEARLEAITCSLGYETWQLCRPDGIILVGMGGGEVCPCAPDPAG